MYQATTPHPLKTGFLPTRKIMEKWEFFTVMDIVDL
jgi:hypothetical protein